MRDNDQINPYAAPTELPATPKIELPELAIDGDLLVVASGVMLPPRCIKSNIVLSDRDVVRRKLSWYGAFQQRMFPRRCELIFYANQTYRWRTIVSGPIGVWIVVLAFAILGRWPFPFMTITAVVSVWAITASRIKLRIVDVKNGRFWIKGCGSDFLESLRSELAEREFQKDS